MKKLPLFTLLFIYLFTSNLIAQLNEWQWVNMSNQENPLIAVDYGNSVYSTGKGLGKQTLSKYDSLGNYLWTIDIINGTSIVNSLKIHQESIYITGEFTGTISIDGLELHAKGGEDMFLAKYDLSGNIEWAIQEGGSSNDVAYAIEVNSDAEVFVTGGFRETVIFGNDTLISKGTFDIFLCKYTSAGELLWAKGAGGNDVDQGMSIDIDIENNVFITGTFMDTAYFDNEMIIANDESLDVFVVKYKSDGELQYLKSYGGPQNDVVYSIAVDSDDGFYLGGRFFDDNFNAPNVGSCLAKFNADANNLWSVGEGIIVYDIALDANKSAYATGRASGTINLGNYHFITDSILFQGSWFHDENVITFKYNAAGNLKSIEYVSDSATQFRSQYGTSVAVFDANNSYTAGLFEGCGNFTGLGELCNEKGSFSGKIISNDLNTGIEVKQEISSIQIFPNPAQNQTTIRYNLAHSGWTSLELYDLTGRRLKILFASQQNKGTQQLLLQTASLKAGIYLYTLRTKDQTFVKKLIVQH